jgi:site-specific recombinase XerD
MLDLYFSHPTRLKQMRNGPLTSHLDALAARLHTEGYRPTTGRMLLGPVGDFNRMLGWLGLQTEDITPELMDRYQTRVMAESRGVGLANALEHLMRQLREDGAIPAAPPETESARPFSELLDRYADWMRRVQGLAESTIRSRVNGAVRFLTWWQGLHPADGLGAMSGSAVLDFIRERDLSHTQISDLRQFCWYLRGEGIATADLARGIPSKRRVRLASEPKHLAWEDVERLLQATDGTDPVGLRDRAVVMLSAHLGLRNCEIRHLLLDDLDWHRSIVRIVESKGGKSRELPLSAPVGEVLAEYIRYGRPYSVRREVFLRHRAPGGVLGTPSAVSGIIRRLARRAGVVLPKDGHNVLRHSLATRLVNREVPIKEISDLLGHASIDTTAIYTLVDMTTLARVAMPFPEEVTR